MSVREVRTPDARAGSPEFDITSGFAEFSKVLEQVCRWSKPSRWGSSSLLQFHGFLEVSQREEAEAVQDLDDLPQQRGLLFPAHLVDVGEPNQGLDVALQPEIQEEPPPFVSILSVKATVTGMIESKARHPF